MMVTALVHFSMPWRCAGSETVLHELMVAAVKAGHDATVVCTHRNSEQCWRGAEPDVWLDGVRIVRVRNALIGGRKVAGMKPDVLVTHHQHAQHAIKIAPGMGARSVFLTHNNMDLNERPLRMRPDLVVFNSDWVRKSLARYGTPKQSMTFHPPLTPERHQVTDSKRGDAVTLVNLNNDKGAQVFYDLAKAEPDRRFLGVVGAHGVQNINRGLPNVTIHAHTPNMAEVWAQTRVLLMPSVYESYGLVAQEAGLNGIPTIANPTPGLVENLGPGGLFADRDQLSEWQMLLQRLDRPNEYRHASEYATQRAAQALAATRDTLSDWVDWINRGV